MFCLWKENTEIQQHPVSPDSRVLARQAPPCLSPEIRQDQIIQSGVTIDWIFLIKSSQSDFTSWLMTICAPQISWMPIFRWKCKITIQIKLPWRYGIKLSLLLEPRKCKLSPQGDKSKYIFLNDWTSVCVMSLGQLIPTLVGNINHWKMSSCKISISLCLPLASIIVFFPLILGFKLNYLIM